MHLQRLEAEKVGNIVRSQFPTLAVNTVA